VSDPAATPSDAGYAGFQRLHELFDRLLEMPADRRDGEIARLTADAPALADDVRALLEHSARAESPLDNGALRLREEVDPRLPVIEGFRLERRIGRGGSATVYLAHQERAEFTREVALKVVDRVLGAESLWHVREEQRILARLEHSGIARLYDAGVAPSGQPFLAMEHVEGQSILDHCRTAKLMVRARLELFLEVLDAVTYAHGEGIVHRDLKPANILVTARGEAKLLDFGIAKLSDPTDEDETRTLERSLTPAYASPEQKRGGRTTAASDIYSLGVVLYELLAGDVPFRIDAKRFGPVQDAIRDQDVETPSAAFARAASTDIKSVEDRVAAVRWRRALRGDLDAVVLKAMREDPAVRYASAAAMADDLRRILAGQPVAARHGDRTYRARKLLRRHATAVITVTVVLSLLAIQQTFSWWRGAAALRPANEVAVYFDAEPLDAETRRSLRNGAERLAQFDGAQARDSFRRAAASSKGRLPGEALAWDGLARAEDARGEVGRAAEAAHRASALIAGSAARLPVNEAERIRARGLAADRKWDTAIPALEGLFGRVPDRVDVGLDLVGALLASGRTEEADNALGRLRQLQAERADPRGDPRIDLIEAEVALRLSEFQRAAAAAERGRVRAAQLSAGALILRAERLHAEAIGRLDRRDEARRDLESVLAPTPQGSAARPPRRGWPSGSSCSARPVTRKRAGGSKRL